tara:strand:+ start:106 stop:468 length:363 start_codon:yes stop_codon:yes gene_type:complete
MALELNNKSLGSKAQSESLDILSGSDDSINLNTTETFAGTIIKIVITTAGTLTSILANDTLQTEILTGTAEGFKNLNGITIPIGTVITPGKYSKGANISSVTTGTATAMVHYKYTLNREA